MIGASGLVGGNIHKLFTLLRYNIVGTHFGFETKHTRFLDTIDIHNPKNFEVEKFSPDVIIHCGALTHVDLCETEPENSYKQTVQSTQNVVEWAKKCHAKVVYISTDYVFDGQSGPYTEDDVANPLSIYGKHKLEAEQIVAQHSKFNLILRITNVYGEEIRGKNFVSRIFNQLIEGEKLTLKLPVDQYSTPINALDVAKCLNHLLVDNKSGIYHLASTDYLNRVSLANRIINHFPESDVNMQIFKTKDLGQAAQRPLKGGLIPQRWNIEYPNFVFSCLEEYLTEKLNHIYNLEEEE